MKNESTCERCGAKVVEYKHSLSKSLIRVLAIVARVVTHESYKSFNPNNDFNMSYSQRSNFQKLRYWSLVEKAGGIPEKGGGQWRITDKGWLFLRGEMQLPKFVWTFRGEVSRFDGNNIYIEEVTGGWKYRPEYASEAQPH